MNLDPLSLILGAILGPLVIKGAYFALSGIAWLTARTVGPGGCHVCDYMPTWEIGERRNWRYLVSYRWHSLLTSRRAWHRAAWAAHWISTKRSSAVHSVECACTRPHLLQVRGPYSAASAAAAVARHHDRACHRGVPHAKVITER